MPCPITASQITTDHRVTHQNHSQGQCNYTYINIGTTNCEKIMCVGWGVFG